MIAEVIPARRMPTSLPYFNYSIPEKLETEVRVGQLVKIPLRSGVEFGVIKKIFAGEDGKLKQISEIICPSPILSAEQLNFLQDVSEFYKTSLGFLLKQNLLPLQKRKIDAFFKKGSDNSSEHANPPETDTTGTMSRPKLHIYNDQSGKNSIISELLSRSGQILYLVPEIADIENVISTLPTGVLTEIIVINSELSEKELFSAWLDIWQNKKRIVIGTRTAFFLPWHNLTTIIVDDEANLNHKSWDMAPRFHSRDAAFFLARHHNSALHLVSHSPSVESYYFAQNNLFDLSGEICKTSALPDVMNMNDEKQRQNFGILAEDVKTKISELNNADIFLFINRLGSFGYLACKDCGEAMLCEKCNRALTYLRDKNQFRCNNCQTTHAPILTCPKCHGQNLRTFAIGTQAVENEVRNLFPDRKILRVDSDADNLDSLKSAEPKIIIGTQFAWSHVDWKRLKMLVLVDFDSALYIPEFKAGEEIWQKLRSALFNLPEGRVIIQTRKPEHAIFSFLYDPKLFYENELRERKMLKYPPYNFLLKMYYGGRDEQEVEMTAKKAYNSLKDLTTEQFAGTILGPLRLEPYWHKGQYWQAILAKIPYKSYKKDTKLLASMVSDAWKIDPNPISILGY